MCAPPLLWGQIHYTLRTHKSQYFFYKKSEKRPPCVKGAPAKRVGDCLLQPLRHGCAVPPPPGLLRSPHEGEAFYKNVVLPPPGLLRSPHTGEAYFLQAPLCKGSSREAGEGLFSVTTPPSQLRCTTSPYTGEAFYKNVV